MRNLNFDPLFSSSENESHMMTVAVSFGAKGKIDSAYFSEKLSKKMAIVLSSRDRVARALMTSELILEEYENSVLIFPVIFARATDSNITFLPESTPMFSGFWPVIAKRDQKKAIKFLDPYLNLYMDPIR